MADSSGKSPAALAADEHEVQPLLSVARFSVGPNTSPGDLEEGADIIDSVAHDLAQAGSGGYDEQLVAKVCIGACARLLFTSAQYRELAKQLRQGGAS
jgi:hypothetical protein